MPYPRQHRSAKRLARWALLAMAMGAASAVAAPDAAELKVGAKAPEFTLKDIKGKTYALKDYRGKKVVLLDFGRFMCRPCQYVVQRLEKLQRRYKDKGVQIFSVNLDGPFAERVVPMGIEHFQLTFPVILDSDFKVAESYKVETIPYLVLIDTKGVVRFTHVVRDPEFEKTLVDQIDKYRPKEKKQ